MRNESHYVRAFTNPYRKGVKIGNYNEDLYGKEFSFKYLSQKPDPNMYLSEKMYRFNWPKPNIAQLSVSGNDITKPHTSNYNLNLIMARDNPRSSLLHSFLNTDYCLENKDKFLPDEITAEDKLRKLSISIDNPNGNGNGSGNANSNSNSIYRETQNILNKYHIKDTSGIFNTKKGGLSNHLLLAHSDNYNSFRQNNYASTYELTMNQKERTDLIFSPKYQILHSQKNPDNKRYDTSDWGFRKFKHYDEFTQYFDRSANNLKRK